MYNNVLMCFTFVLNEVRLFYGYYQVLIQGFIKILIILGSIKIQSLIFVL